MLLVGERVGSTYHEADMLRMFKKVDVNGDRLVDLNEFLLMQVRSPHISHPHTLLPPSLTFSRLGVRACFLMQITAKKGDPCLSADGEPPPDVPVGVHPVPKPPSHRDDQLGDDESEYEYDGEEGFYDDDPYGYEDGPYGDPYAGGAYDDGGGYEYDEEGYGEGYGGEGYGEGAYSYSDQPSYVSLDLR